MSENFYSYYFNNAKIDYNITTNKNDIKMANKYKVIFDKSIEMKLQKFHNLHFYLGLLLASISSILFTILCISFASSKKEILDSNLMFWIYFGVINGLLLLSCLFATYIILMVARKTFINSKYKRLLLVTHHGYKYWVLFLTTFLLYSIISTWFFTFFLETCDKQAENIAVNDGTNIVKVISTNNDTTGVNNNVNYKTKTVCLMQLLLPVSIVLYFILLRQIFLMYITIQIYYKHYKNRIEEYNKKTQLAHLMDKDQLLNQNIDIRSVIKQMYDKININKNIELSFTDFEIYYGKELAYQIFELFDDKTQDDLITELEFIRYFVELYEEKNALQRCITGNKNILRKIKIIMNCLVYPAAFFIASLSVGKFVFFSNVLKGFLGIILPASFIFGSVLSEMFRSLIYLFNVRPFDAGDCIMIDEKIYEVYELGLLYSTLSYEKRTCNVTNESLRNKIVYNLRNVKYTTEQIHVQCNFTISKEKFRDLKRKLKEFLISNKKDYIANSLELKNFEFYGKNECSFFVTIKVIFTTFEMREYTKRKDKIKFFLYGLLEGAKITNK
ncbi:hypothetical protein BDAP_000212 [Binucleata daphniae]